MAAFRKPYRLIKHTGDLGMVVRGNDLKDLFSQAARAFFDIILDVEGIAPVLERKISVQAPDREALLVAWLGELLYLFETKRLVFSKFLINDLGEQSLSVQAWGEPFNTDKHKVKEIFKAVTYHQLRIWEDKGVWRARIIFDL
jgi:SHS2 domain-containing protein